MISIVIPTYNEEKIIETTVRQFASLDRKDFEVIVSDSRSADRTVAIAKEFADHVVVLAEGQKRGIAQGRNDGARVARGEYLVFVDADIAVPDPTNFFKKALRAFADHPKLVAITGRIEVAPDKATTSDKIVCLLRNVNFATVNNVFGGGMSAGEFQMIRTATFREAKGFNEKLVAAEDIDLFGRLAKMGQVRTVWALAVYETGRRFHQVGAWTTLYGWIKNTLYSWIFKRAAVKEWEAIR